MKLLVAVCVLLCMHSVTAAVDPIFREVATAFVFKGFERADPFELSPDQQKHQALMEMNNAIARGETLPPNQQASQEAEAPVLIEQPDEAKVMEQLKVATEQQKKEAESPSLVETTSERRKFIGALASGFGALKNFANKLTGKYRPSNSQIYEDCMACRMVWKQVEMDISNPRYVEDVQASFEHNCMDAQKSTIFYKGCEDMYDDMYAMTDDYMSGQYTTSQMCQRAKMCVEPTLNK